jgi:hypothetical protein
MQLIPICIHMGLDFTIGGKKTREEIFYGKLINNQHSGILTYTRVVVF